MKRPQIPSDEEDRLADLRALAVLDTPRESRFDRITELARDVFGVPVAFISMVDANRQWFKSIFGVEGLTETPREVSFCAHTILEPDALVIRDTTRDDRFADNPFVTGDYAVRFYAGIPLRGRKGKPVGTFCLLDRKPRDFPPSSLDLLKKFAALVQAELIRSGQQAEKT